MTIGGIEDHIHFLVRLNPAVAVADLVKLLKGSSSHLITTTMKPDAFFKWQGGYGAFTLRKSEKAMVIQYIQNQKQHHSSGTLQKDWEKDP